VFAISIWRENSSASRQAADLLGDLRAFALDEGDPVPAVAPAELFDFSER